MTRENTNSAQELAHKPKNSNLIRRCLMAIKTFTRRYRSWHEMPLLLSTKDLCSIFGVDERTIRYKCESGQIPAVKVSGKWFVDRDVLREFMKGEKSA